MSKLVVEYAPADVAETRHYKIAMKVPPKWLEPARKTKVKKILDAFGKSYDAKFGAGALGTDELGLMEPRAQGKTFDADDLVVDAVAAAGAGGLRVVQGAFKKAPEPEPVAPANDLPPDPRNASGKYRSVARRLQQDQPTVAEHVNKPKTKLYTYGVIADRGTPYQAGPWDVTLLGPNPPVCHKGTIFEGLVDEASPGRIRVVREATGANDGYWVCRIRGGKETVTLVAKGTPVRAGYAYAPPKPKAPEPEPKPKDPQAQAAWDNYLKNGLGDEHLPRAPSNATTSKPPSS